MKKAYAITISIFLLIFLSGCGTIAQLATSKHEPYSSVRKIALLAPEIKNNMVTVPLDLTESKFRFNSGLTIRKIKTTVDGEFVYFYVVSCVAGESLALKGRPTILINNPSRTSYSVFYQDPDDTKHEVGKIQIN
jgi:uncharacterized protein YceK